MYYVLHVGWVILILRYIRAFLLYPLPNLNIKSKVISLSQWSFVKKEGTRMPYLQ